MAQVASTEKWTLADGTILTLRPITPADAAIEQALVRGLSTDSRYFRFMGTLRELTPDALVRFTQIDYDREMAFVAVQRTAAGESEIGVARYVAEPDGRTCEFAVVISDKWQHRGLGRRMLSLLIDTARDRGLKTIAGSVLRSNTAMLSLATLLGFSVSDPGEDSTMHHVALSLAPG